MQGRALHRLDAAGFGLLSLAAIAGLAALPALPAEVAVHFGPSGSPDGYLPATVGVLAVPAVGAVALALARLGPRVGRSVGVGTRTTTPPVVGLVVAAFLAYVQGVVLAWNLGVRVDPTVAVVPAALVLVAVVLLAVRRSSG